jgi:hypothetical protein
MDHRNQRDFASDAVAAHSVGIALAAALCISGIISTSRKLQPPVVRQTITNRYLKGERHEIPGGC